MKNIILFTILIIGIKCKAQVYPLTTDTDVPNNTYIKDTNNDLPAFEGTWKGTWNGKALLINFKKIEHYLDTHLKNNPFYRDLLVGKFQVKDPSGNILFDNLSIADNSAKITGGKIFPNGKYVLSYVDPELCFKGGRIFIEFTNSSKTEIKFKFMETSNLIDTDCFYHGKPADQRPEPLPKEIILIKQ
ncbi:hypothetical protein EG346_09395 [Chryseobacterium carnipullorum]|uniref:DUF6705 domain-containing protein n=1 Tax=Chryseobacterium carnipullorum TaxID=1124835 RepID=A0A376DP86_CHRCU|nr:MULTISPECIES: DUF6705 family protein [Chryseobacterium]AZA48386.1 hypothetical protein EG346_09395 [Chryseobacterium carnipullorum]AZA63319.1 hypothetical protein EG345_00305 [Chryseobacterium carnipullorum]STC92150.1 Uncharacterised protein [Chryseobacterium carnipullorum]HCA08089.1 hypothetical protein [Chryseobacterium sp.]